MEYSEKYVNSIRDRLLKWTELRDQAEALNKTRLDDLVSFVNRILIEENCPTITKGQIQFYPQYIGNTGIGQPIDRTLTNIIYDYYYPRAKSGKYAHFTDIAALRAILATKKIRLTSTIKRKDEWEFKLFYKDHNIDGFDRSFNGSTFDESLMKELFYISLTENKGPEVDSRRGMWRYFGKGGFGVKIIMDVRTDHTDFRTVFYQNFSSLSGKTLLHKLNEVMEREFSKPFVFNSISKIGVFYISKDFQDEYESRFLIKLNSDDYPFPFDIHKFGEIPYIELEFDSPWASFVPVQVQPGIYCDRNDIINILNESGLHIEVLPNATSI